MAKVTNALGDDRQVLHALLHAGERAAVEGLSDPVGDVTHVTGDPAGLGGELADVGQGRAGPGFAAGLVGLDQRRPDVGVGRQRLEGNDAGAPLPEQAGGGRDHGGLGRQVDLAVYAELGLHPFVLHQADRLHPADPDAAQGDRRPDAEAADRAEARGVGGLLLVHVRLAQPERAEDHQGERRQHGQAHREFVGPLHRVLPAAAGSPGRPSMNWRTTGSPVARISSTLPTWRMAPS